MMPRVLLLLSCLLALTASEAAAPLRGLLSGPRPAGLGVAVAKHGAEDPALPAGRLASGEIGADGAFAIAASGEDQYAVTLGRDGLVLWGRSHVKPGSDLGTITLPEADGGLAGSVSGADGKPLPGVRLRLWRKHDNTCDHWSISQRLDADGKGGFVLSGLTRGIWAVSLDDPAWAPTRSEITVGGGVASLALVAKPAAALAGTVRDEAGNPVAGATVGDDEHSTTSAADGTWRIGGLGAGEFHVRAHAAGLALPDNAPVEAKLTLGGTATVDLILHRTGSLRVTVRQADPAAALPTKVRVELERSGRGGYDRTEHPLAEGALRLPDLAPGGYQLQVAGDGTGTARVPVTITAGQEGTVEAVLPRVYAYAGTLTLPEGVDRTKIEVSGWVEIARNGEDGFSSSNHHEAEVAADGSFRLPTLEAGTLRLSLKAPGCVPQSHRIAIGPGGESEGTYALARGATLRVRITADGKPLPKATARLDGPGDEDWRAESGDDGVAVLDGVADGAMKLTVEHDEWRPHSAKLELPLGEPELAVPLERGLAITGSVLDADGKPVAEAYVSAWMTRGRDSNHRSGRSAADGTFRLAGLAPGTWRLSAHADGETLAQLAAVAAGASGVKLQARGKATLEIVVLRPDGTPATGLALTLDPENASNQTLTTGADGRATAALHRGQAWRLAARPEGFSALARSGTVPSEGAIPAVELRLDAGRTLRGRLLGHDGRPVPQLGVAVARQAGRRRGGDADASAQPDDQGAFVIAGLTPGPLVLTVTAASGRGQLLQQDVLVPAVGDPPVLELVLPALGSISGRLRDPPANKERANIMLANPLGRVHLWAEADAEGGFRFPQVPVGSYAVVGYRMGPDGGGTQASANCTVSIGTDSVVELGAAPTAGDRRQLRGSIALPEGITGSARVTLVADPDRPVTATTVAGMRGGPNATLGEDGTFALPAVAPGRYLLHLSVMGGSGWQPNGNWGYDLTVDDDPRELALAPRGLTLPVRVLDPQGVPVGEAQVTAIPREGQLMRRWVSSATGTTGEDGSATVRWLAAPAVCDVLVFHQTLGRFELPEVAVRPGMPPLELRFAERVALRGTVGAPAGAIVHLVARSPDGFVRQDVTADENGSYAFTEDDLLHPGEWDVWAVATGCAVAHRRLTLKTAATVDFTLVAGGRIVLQVQGDATHSPLGCEPEVRDAAGEVVVRPRLAWEKAQRPQLVVAPLEADGSGEIDGLAPGRYTVGVADAAPVTVEVQPGTTTVARLRLGAP